MPLIRHLVLFPYSDIESGSRTATTSNTLTMASGSPISFWRSNRIHAARPNQATRPIAAAETLG